MDRCYEKFLRLGIDLAPLGIERRADNTPYDCTPKGADILGWAGVDGIHFCRVRGFGARIFAVSPMNSAPDHIHLIAEDFEHLLRLLLACGDAAALEQAWQWDAAQFAAFLEEYPPDAAQKDVLDAIRTGTGLTPLPEPWAYLDGLNRSFDYRRLRYSEDFAPFEPAAPAPAPWRVCFEGGFSTQRGRAGAELPLGARFSWAGRQWLVPAAYLCAKGLVLDLCMRVEAEAMRAFAEKWGLCAENDDAARFSPEERAQIELENPLCINVRPRLTANGKPLSACRGYAGVYWPEGGACDAEEAAVAAHYGLDAEAAWLVMRHCFPWNGRRPSALRTLTLELRAEPAAVPGPRFTVRAPGETAALTLPDGSACTLRVVSLEPQTLPMSAPKAARWFYPRYFTCMTYTLSPEPAGRFTLTDCAEADQPLEIKPSEEAPAAACIGIIGGADGPTAIVFGGKGAEGCRAACSAPHFEPVEGAITWRVTVYEERFPAITCSLFKREPNPTVCV